MRSIVNNVVYIIVGIVITLVLVEGAFPFISVHIYNRKHLLSISLDDRTSGIIGKNYNMLYLTIKNIHPKFTVEDINLNIDFSGAIENIIKVTDEGVFGYEDSKGQEALVFSSHDETVGKTSTNHRNIKIEKIFPDSELVLSIILKPNLEGNFFAPNKLTEAGTATYSISYSYKFWGTTVRRKIS